MRRAARAGGGRWSGPARGLALALALAGAGCAHLAGHASEKATAGAMSELQKQVAAVPPEMQGVIAERQGAGAMRGALDELAKAERKRQLAGTAESTLAGALRGIAAPGPEGLGGAGAAPLSLMSRELADGVATGMVERIQRDLGPDGSLTAALAGTTERMTASAAASLRQELLMLGQTCEGTDDPFACLELRARSIGEAAAHGLAAGLAAELRWPLILLAFVAGITFGAFVRSWFARLARAPHRRVREAHG